MATTATGSLVGAKPTNYNSTPTVAASAAPKTLQANDFINLLITQLKNQDPTQPMSNSELLQQVSQIGQLQSQNALQTSLSGLVLQNQISSASNLIGKQVVGTDAQSNATQGIVTSISVANNTVSLNLDSGQTLPIANVTQITTVNPTTAAPSTNGASTSGAGTNTNDTAAFAPGITVTKNSGDSTNPVAMGPNQ